MVEPSEHDRWYAREIVSRLLNSGGERLELELEKGIVISDLDVMTATVFITDGNHSAIAQSVQACAGRNRQIDAVVEFSGSEGRMNSPAIITGNATGHRRAGRRCKTPAFLNSGGRAAAGTRR